VTADEVIARMGLTPHPEGGHYRQTWAAEAGPGNRPAGTCIYFLLAAGERSHWHRVDAAEIWHHYAGGAPRAALGGDRGLSGRGAAAGAGPSWGRGAAEGRAGRVVAGGGDSRGLVARRLHGESGVPLRRVRAGGRRASRFREPRPRGGRAGPALPPARPARAQGSRGDAGGGGAAGAGHRRHGRGGTCRISAPKPGTRIWGWPGRAARRRT
jgi:hypothetical protein